MLALLGLLDVHDREDGLPETAPPIPPTVLMAFLLQLGMNTRAAIGFMALSVDTADLGANRCRYGQFSWLPLTCPPSIEARS